MLMYSVDKNGTTDNGAAELIFFCNYLLLFIKKLNFVSYCSIIATIYSIVIINSVYVLWSN